jgi:hypothetical protein
MALTEAALAEWLERYFHAWRVNDAAEVGALFAEDATYHYGPFTPPAIGRAAIVANWVADPQQQTDLQITYEPLAIRGEVGIAHWRVAYRPGADPTRRVDLDGIIVLTFDSTLCCIEHREWYARRETPDAL